MQPISINTYFPTLRAFSLACRHDKSLTPSAQLLFRILAEQANSSRWTDTFTLSLDELEALSHLSRQTLINARRTLKSKGYINFKGNPSQYTVNSLIDCQLDCKPPPTPPVLIPQYNTKEERKERRKGENGNDASNSNNPNNGRQHRDHTPPAPPQIQNLINHRLKALGY